MYQYKHTFTGAIELEVEEGWVTFSVCTIGTKLHIGPQNILYQREHTLFGANSGSQADKKPCIILL